MTKEQQTAKELAASAESRLKNLKLQTQKDCKARFAPNISTRLWFSYFLKIRLSKLGCRSLTSRDLKWNKCSPFSPFPPPPSQPAPRNSRALMSVQALMAAPPDFAMVREVRAKALKLQQNLRDLRSMVDSKEALLMQLHSAMGLTPRYCYEKTESDATARVIAVGDVVDKFSAFEKSVLEKEKLLQQQREIIAAQEEEIDSLRHIAADEERRCVCFDTSMQNKLKI